MMYSEFTKYEELDCSGFLSWVSPYHWTWECHATEPGVSAELSSREPPVIGVIGDNQLWLRLW